jgi:hypothetical protein
MIRACGTLVEYTRFQDWRVSVTLKKKKKRMCTKDAIQDHASTYQL